MTVGVDTSTMGTRRRTLGRMIALQALCAYEGFGEEFDAELSAVLTDESLHAELGMDEPVDVDTLAFARRLAQGAWVHRNRIDQFLAASTAHWSVARMTPVDRNTLRLGVYELLEEADTPPQVVVSEAIEVAQRFGDRDSAAFVNGVLDAVRRSLCESASKSPAACPAEEEEETEAEDLRGTV